MVRRLVPSALLALALLAALAGPAGAQGAITSVRLVTPDQVVVRFSQAPARTDASNFRFASLSAPDVPIQVKDARVGPDGDVTLTVAQTLDKTEGYRVQLLDPPLTRDQKPSRWALLFTVIISSALINNFVFTRYLGLCIFFGVSKKRDTAVGMGITFTLVMVTTGMLSWALYMFVMKPLQLRFLQVIVFIGVVAFMVQLLDTVLKKINKPLHSKFGIYLVLITTNCIILAVPLLNAAAETDALGSLGLAMGSGFGFALAMFLMSCARERVELARVPTSFQGLPIAFALAGLFALAFMGFSGLSFMR